MIEKLIDFGGHFVKRMRDQGVWKQAETSHSFGECPYKVGLCFLSSIVISSSLSPYDENHFFCVYHPIMGENQSYKHQMMILHRHIATPYKLKACQIS